MVAAVSVRVITGGASCGTWCCRDMLPGRLRDLDLARRAVGQVVELEHPAVAPLVDEALDQPAVQAADEVGVGLGQLAERAVGEGDRGAVVVDDGLGVEAERGQLGDERLGAGAGAGRRSAAAAPCSRPASTASAAERSAAAASRSSIRASTGKAGGSRPSDGASAASE